MEHRIIERDSKPHDILGEWCSSFPHGKTLLGESIITGKISQTLAGIDKFRCGVGEEEQPEQTGRIELERELGRYGEGFETNDHIPIESLESYIPMMDGDMPHLFSYSRENRYFY